MEKYFKKTNPKVRDKAQPKSVADILKTVMKDIGMSQMHELGSIVETWSDTVGAVVAQNSRPIGLEKGRLVVEVSNPVWKQELEGFQSAAIIAKVNAVLKKKAVRRISCVLAR